MSSFIISPRISDSARDLAASLTEANPLARVLPRRTDRGRGNYVSRAALNVVINWGCSSPTAIQDAGIRVGSSCRVYNVPQAIERASNKLTAFRTWSAIPHINNLEFTADQGLATRWVNTGNDQKVYCRTTLRGHSGDGIVVARNQGEIVRAPLYTKGIDIHHEFRFHVVNGVVIDGVRKAFDPSVPEADRNRDVMNHAAGTIFVRSGPALVQASENRELMSMAVAAVTSLGLDFGAVDILKDRQGRYYVIEVNTACGLTGTTLERYTRAFTEMLSSQPMTPWSMAEFAGTPEVETTTQPTGTIMNISNATSGMRVTFSSQGNRISTLTNNRTYVIERVSLSTIFVRNDLDVLKAYQPLHFTSAEVPQAPQRVGANDGSIDTTVPPTSAERIVLLADGTSVNVTGTCTFNGQSQRIPRGEHVIHDMRMGAETGDVFLGIQLEDEEHVYRFNVTNFSGGSVEGQGTPGSTPRVAANQVPDIENRMISVGSKIQVRVSAGGHGLSVGTLAEVTHVNVADRSISIVVGSRTVRLHPQRVAKLTDAQFVAATRELAQLEEQGTTSFTLGAHTYRVPSNDIGIINEMLSRFTV